MKSTKTLLFNYLWQNIVTLLILN